MAPSGTEFVHLITQYCPELFFAVETGFVSAVFAPISFWIHGDEFRFAFETDTFESEILFGHFGDTRITCFVAHMARLTKANQVVSSISFFGCRKRTVRAFVVDRHTFAYMYAAISTTIVLFFDDGESDLRPINPMIGQYTTDPIWGVFARLKESSVFVATFCGTVFSSKTARSCLPRFSKEFLVAMFTDKANGFHPSRIVLAFDLFGCEPTWITLSWFPDLIDFYDIGLAQTASRTKSPSRPVRGNVHFLFACFTVFGDSR